MFTQFCRLSQSTDIYVTTSDEVKKKQQLEEGDIFRVPIKECNRNNA